MQPSKLNVFLAFNVYHFFFFLNIYHLLSSFFDFYQILSAFFFSAFSCLSYWTLEEENMYLSKRCGENFGKSQLEAIISLHLITHFNFFIMRFEGIFLFNLFEKIVISIRSNMLLLFLIWALICFN